MNKDKIINSVSDRIRVTGQEMAEEMYEGWQKYVSELDSNLFSDEEWKELHQCDENGKPSYDVIYDSLTFGLGFAKAHQYPEDLIGEDVSEEEMDYYDKMTDYEVASLLEEGIEAYLKTKYLQE